MQWLYDMRGVAGAIQQHPRAGLAGRFGLGMKATGGAVIRAGHPAFPG